MSKYSFKGTIDLGPGLPFEIIDGIVIFHKKSKNYLSLNKDHILLNGYTEEGRNVYFLVEHFYETEFRHGIQNNVPVLICPRIEGIVEACAILDSGSIDAVDSIGFYSLDMPKITGHSISGALNDSNSSLMGIKDTMGSYTLNGHNYRLSIGFVENLPIYSGQLLEIKTDGFFDITMMKDTYWLMKKLLSFIYQKREIPVERIYLKSGGANIGQLYVEKIVESDNSLLSPIKCIPLNFLGDKLDNLLQLLADSKLYLRHIPLFKEEEIIYTPGRFLMALAGLESVLDCLNVHVSHNEKHNLTIEAAKQKLMQLQKNSTGYEKRIYRRCVEQLEQDENLEQRIKISLIDNEQFINNIFAIEMFDGLPLLAHDLAEYRNKLAHGKLDFELDTKSVYQMRFLILYILYLQLLLIGFNKKEASEIVPNILFPF